MANITYRQATQQAPASTTTKNATLTSIEIDGNFKSLNDAKVETSDVTSTNTANKIVARDASGNFSAGTITASLNGNAATSTKVGSLLIRGEYLTGNNFDGSASTTWAVMASSGNAYGTIVARDASGNFSASTITATLNGNASTASKFATARSINGVSFDGSVSITITAATPNTLTRGSYLTGINFNGSSATTWSVDATSDNTASKVVARDASGNFSAGTITASLNGNASTASKFVTARTINGVSFDGSANITIVDSTKYPNTGGAIGGAISEKSVAIAAANIDCSLGNLFTKTIDANITLTVSNVFQNDGVTSFILELTNGGSKVITWWSNIQWEGGIAPTLTAAGKDILGFYTRNAGATWNGLIIGENVK